MSNFPGYKTKAFSPSQKFFVLDPNTGSPSFVQGSDLVSQLTPNSNYVYAESTRTNAQATDYALGSVIQTGGATSVGDNLAGVYLVVPSDEGDFPMDNGNELLVLAGDDTLREQLALNTTGNGSDLIAHTGTSDTVTEALDKRTIYVGSVADLLNVAGPEDGQHYQTTSYHRGWEASAEGPQGGGVFVWDSAKSKTLHNGGSVIDPDKAFPDWGVDAEVEAWFTPAGSGSGCFVHTSPSSVWVEQFGAIADNNRSAGNGSDNYWPMFTAINYALTTYDIALRSGDYRVSRELNIKRQIKFRGFASGTNDNPASRLYFDSGEAGIILNYSNTYSDRLQEPGDPTGNGAGSIVDSVGVYGSGSDDSKSGIWLRGRGVITNCLASGFPGYGIKVLANASSGFPDSERGNANNFYLASCRASSNGLDGIHVEGNDANAGVGVNVDGSVNGGWGISDESFLGNTWIGTHTSGNSLGPHRAITDNAQSIFIGPYSEGGQGPAQLNQRSIAIGGQHDLGTDGNGTGPAGAHWHSTFLNSLQRLRTVGSDYGDVFIQSNATNGRSFVLGNAASMSTTRKTHVSFEVDGSELASIWASPQDIGTGRHSVGIDIYDSGAETWTPEVIWDGSGRSYRPITDNVWRVGSASKRWSEIFAANATINTSDAREKQQIRDLSKSEKRVAVALKSQIRAFKWNDSVKKKGDGARIHFGAIAQEVEDAFRAEGLDPEDYSLLCYDEWEETPEVIESYEAEYDDSGKITKEAGRKIIQEYEPAGNRYGVRYEELFAFIISAL